MVCVTVIYLCMTPSIEQLTGVLSDSGLCAWATRAVTLHRSLTRAVRHSRASTYSCRICRHLRFAAAFGIRRTANLRSTNLKFVWQFCSPPRLPRTPAPPGISAPSLPGFTWACRSFFYRTSFTVMRLPRSINIATAKTQADACCARRSGRFERLQWHSWFRRVASRVVSPAFIPLRAIVLPTPATHT